MKMVAAIAAIGAAVGLIWFDQGSLERGNRLYRDGDPPAAVEVYERVPSAGYNLGTALLGIDADSSEVLLRLATESEDGNTAQRGYYNLGYRPLALSQGPMGRDSAISVLGQAVVSNRAALRLDPNDQDARWNLALAQRGFDGLVIPPNEAARESGSDSDDEIASNDQTLARAENAESESGQEEDPREADNSGEREGTRDGAREAWATQDPGPISRTDAFELLATVIDEPEALIRGILWSRRPDVAWWANQPYPGGPW